MIRTKGEGGEKEREATEEDGEGGKEAKVTEAWGEREVRMIEGKRMEHLEDDKREKVRGAKTGGEARRKG